MAEQAPDGGSVMAGPRRWQAPPDATPERTTVALGRWQRRRVARSLAGLPPVAVEPRWGLRGALIGGVVLTVVLLAASLAVGGLR